MLASKLHQNESIKEDVEHTVASTNMVKPSDVAVYGLYPNTEDEEYCKSLISERTGLICVNELDSVSEVIGEDFNRLYRLYMNTLKKK